MDQIWDRKSFEVGGHWPSWRIWKKRMTTQNRQKWNAEKTTTKKQPFIAFLLVIELSHFFPVFLITIFVYSLEICNALYSLISAKNKLFRIIPTFNTEIMAFSGFFLFICLSVCLSPLSYQKVKIKVWE